MMSVIMVALPLISFLILGINNKIIDKEFAKIFAFSNMMLASFIAIYLLYSYGLRDAAIDYDLGDWIRVGKSYISWKIYLDSLSMIMFAIVTIISTLVHLYSIAYMSKDENIVRFLAYLSLFTFSMLVLVASRNFLQLFLGWEAVGFCSYLLIGFWYNKNSASIAANKAFIVNRISDFAFIVAILFIFHYCHSLDFDIVFAMAEELKNTAVASFNALDIICLLLFIGCMGKSAQLILHVWLPDAMEGPTPVSALIHAATMVTAGVFLLARASFLFEHSQILYFITLIGLATAIYGGLMALRQSDIKKVIAFSTCSQLGYMVMACGLSCYDLAIFHLATHAFFKALLFLAAGSVIHATHQQELSQLGGLKKAMPITYITFLIGSLAIMGIYPFAGYYSKEAILFASYGKEPLLFYCALVASGFTTLYSIKLILFVFHGRTKEYEHPPHESPLLMIAPMTLLALGAMFMGWYLENVFNIVSQTQGYFKSTIFIAAQHKVAYLEPSTLLHNMPLIISAISTIAMVMFFYSKTLQKIFAYVACCIFDYFDAFYNVVFVRIFNYLSCCSIWVDIKIFDGLGPKATMSGLNALSKAIKKLHNGYISNYTNYLIIVFLSVITTLMYIIY